MGLPEILAGHRGRGYVVAPAGHGKTYLIADSTARTSRRQLILTHTYAGVNALRSKMRSLGVSSKLYQLDTIAGWALRLSLAYSDTSGWVEKLPSNNERWSGLYRACSRLLERDFIKRIVRASYDGVYVDEYQDCSMRQHELILKLSQSLPCRVLGDPLQGIFDFGGEEPVDWTRDVEGNFRLLGTLKIPHRWVGSGSAELGLWLQNARTALEEGRPIDLRSDKFPALHYKHASGDTQALIRVQSSTCRYFKCEAKQTVVAIHGGGPAYKAKCHRLSRNLGGLYSSLEEVEGKDLFSFVRKLDGAGTANEALRETIVFAKKCMTNVQSKLPAGTVRGEHVSIRANTRNAEAARHANGYLVTRKDTFLRDFLLVLSRTEGIKVTRADLFYRALGVFNKHALNPDVSLVDAAEMYQGEFRHMGRPTGRRRLVGTTLLVKGLEYDHAIVLDAVSLSRKELYVAITRGSRSLTIISANPILNPET